jgi:hypothetical protein
MYEQYECLEETHETDGILTQDIMIISDTKSTEMNQASLDYHDQFDPAYYAPILGYHDLVSEEDYMSEDISGTTIGPEHLGLRSFKLVKGHHRAFVSRKKGVNVRFALVNNY